MNSFMKGHFYFVLAGSRLKRLSIVGKVGKVGKVGRGGTWIRNNPGKMLSVLIHTWSQRGKKLSANFSARAGAGIRSSQSHTACHRLKSYRKHNTTYGTDPGLISQKITDNIQVFLK
jgi:hypothetical protein